MTTTIYALVDPRNHEVRYVGRTRHFHKRIQVHRRRVEETRKGIWTNELRENGYDLIPVKLAEVDDIHAAAAEQFWIAQGRLFGWALTNTMHNASPNSETFGEAPAVTKQRPVVLQDEFVSFPIVPPRRLTATEIQVVLGMSAHMSKSQLTRTVYGHKDGKTWRYIQEALGVTVESEAS